MIQLEKNWQGYKPLASACYPHAGLKPACIRVDESRGFIINVTDVTGDDAGLVVVDKENGNVLWAQRWVRPSNLI